MLSRSMTRRLALQTSLGLLAGPGLAQARLPQFRTARYQFIELDPVEPMAPLTLQGLDGRPAIARPVPGKVNLIYLWATWCPVCRITLPRFERQLADFRAQDVEIVSISTDERELPHVRDYLKRVGVKRLPVFHDRGGKVIAGSGAGQPLSTAEGLPVIYVTDRRGGVRGYMLGEADWASPAALALLDHVGTL
ncbi:Thiol-disulfide isomerase/thioredoxin [Bosea sp. 62]|uniref:TlpA disulfide reductase family protein n=2 Tax=unclassified Bosea (in: a-proteobacteria) TaxID=2653178 RepID=UPI00125B2D12|nr:MULTISPECIES: TlpA disulfide reductase family protein [unclassified Bosea (in: a-proteobacteria)]CAD5249393.1 Thiol-disulfide isomerase/thioredoxin [Bosea sp. 21B]VXB01143.1 Thiol-disulfide isomerase/thioredoxin [Bosea sp. 125]CAD5247955.1 Thiol-disulfide isomerase/thioredoxin [Bosea sp. 46]CAD5266727.1 Thiol-disulfide isomerase/thioredoxin [Bosea sp. 7B]VVT45022.1 Thiol-disulfide isomerase or thioredoxin [Bosea sp. EC-HK365B]